MDATGEPALEVARGGRVGLYAVAMAGVVYLGTWAYARIRTSQRRQLNPTNTRDPARFLSELVADNSVDRAPTRE